MKPFVVLAIPGMYLVYKYNQFKRQQQENSRRKVAEKELNHLNQKIVSKCYIALAMFISQAWSCCFQLAVTFHGGYTCDRGSARLAS